MTENPLISVIVPVYKVERYLPKCVESILNQTYRNLEVILVDDGSPDGCGAICDGFAEQDSRVRVIHKKNGGLSDARNAGLEIAQGEFIAFADSDDWLEPEAYEALLGLSQKYNAKMVCGGRFDEDDAQGTCTVGLCPEKEEFVEGKELVRRIFRWDHLDSAAWDKLYARELFQEIRYPVGRIVEDVPTTYRLVLLAGGAAMLPKPIYHYVHRAQSITTSSVSEKSFHAPENAALVYEDIRQNLPELEPDARYLLTKYQELVAQELALTDRPIREQYIRQYRQLLRSLRGKLGFAYRDDGFSLLNRIVLTLTAFGWFPAVVKIGRFLKKMRK